MESSNLFDEERGNIFGKIYFANVKNRLRELEFPNDIDCKRWIWELVQNAKDSISNHPDRNGVDIKIKIENDIYSFSHNGSPFTMKTLTALLYKFSEGKSNNGESTGRFGTGFLTTHSLSKIVKIKGDIILKNKDDIQGFKLIMYREGEDEELLEGLKKTEKSFELIKSDGWTSYEYEAITSRNKEAGKLGIQNFKENIDKVMLFCPEIKTIELNDNGKILSINRSYIDNNPIVDCKKITFNKIEEKNNSQKIFIYTQKNEHNDKLTEKFNTDRNIRICCAIELDKDDNIIVEPKSPCLFCSLPLVGSEAFELPFIINSPDFEPDSERQTILLDGNDISEETGKISDPGINKMILDISKDMYKSLINYICLNNIKNRFHLARGLVSVPNITRFFDRKIYANNFMLPMRDILLDFLIVYNGVRYYKLTEINLPIIRNYHNIEIQKKVYSFISKIYKGEVPPFEESNNFEKSIWKGDSRIKYINIEKCVKLIEAEKNMQSLINKIDIDFAWYDDFLVFIKKYHHEYLEKYSLIPNMDLEFVKLTNNISSSENVPDNMINCLVSLGSEWKKNHINKNIKNFTTGTDHNIDYAVSAILNIANNNLNKSLILMQYIPYNEKDKKFIEKRNDLFEFCSIIWKDILLEKKDGSNFPKELWERIDDFIILKIIENIQNFEGMKVKYNCDFIKNFLIFSYQKEYYTKCLNFRLFPNQKHKLDKISNLCEDVNIPDEFKNCLNDCFQVDIRNDLLDRRFNFLNLPILKKRMFDYNYILKDNFNSFIISTYQKEEAAKRLLKILPKKNDKEEYNNDLYDRQRNLFNLYQFFSKETYKYIEIDINDLNEGIWLYSNQYIYDIIIKIIEQYNNINSLSEYLQKNIDETFNSIRTFLKYSKKGKIIVNQNNEFSELYDGDTPLLYNEGKDIKESIPEKLKDISKYLGYDARKYLVHEKMGRACSDNNVISYDSFCTKIDELIIEKYNNKNNYIQQDFKTAAIFYSKIILTL